MVRVAFCQDMAYEYLGVMYLSAVLKQEGHEVEVFIDETNSGIDSKKKLVNEIAKWKPDIIAFSCTTPSFMWALETARLTKETIAKPTIFGGPHPTFSPEIIEDPAVDFVCRGEGEAIVKELFKTLNSSADYTGIKGLWVKKDNKIFKNPMRLLIEDLDSIPFPDRELYIGKYKYLSKSQKNILSGRGCPFDCSYCFNHKLKQVYADCGQYIRWRKPENVIKEIESIQNKYKVKNIHMQDDTFILNKAFLKTFCELYEKRISIPFVCLVRPDLLTEEIAGWLKKADCRIVFMGVESGSEDMRVKVLKRKITDKQIIDAAEYLKKNKIRFRTYNILGLPGETLEQAWETVALNQRIKTDYPWCSLLYPYKGTDIGDYIEREGMLEDSIKYELNSFFKTSIIRSPVRRELSNLQKLFCFAVLFPFLNKIIKFAVKLPENIVFDFLFLASYTWVFWRSEDIELSEVISIGFRSLKSGFYFKKRVA
jgi:radical SAM superfamily enzyme YgiQ (UPF0313 family)